MLCSSNEFLENDKLRREENVVVFLCVPSVSRVCMLTFLPLNLMNQRVNFSFVHSRSNTTMAITQNNGK